MKLTWHSYRYYSYERELAKREATALLNGARLHKANCGFELVGSFDTDRIRHLTYFAGIKNGRSFTHTIQDRLETGARRGKNRQATRYSAHGIHEYKGKFNPQVAKVLLNIFGVRPGDNVLDPFCGSGTTLIECAHMGALGYGTDLNPLAVYIANAKLQALTTQIASLRLVLDQIAASLRRTKQWTRRLEDDTRSVYLKSWFDLPILQTLEIVHARIEAHAGHFAPVFLVIASNLLRDYSQQDPHDLRMRRRKSPPPDTPFVDAFLHSADQVLARLDEAQSVLGHDLPLGKAILRDVTTLTPKETPSLFDAAITSPPYAMALPYIDTQRLSLVWLGLLHAGHILEFEAELIGSREFRGSARHSMLENLEANVADLPAKEAEFCAMLQRALGPKDGFRRKAVPRLLYRYFAAMKDSLSAIHQTMKPGAPFGLIIGHNYTVLDGVRHGINTPEHIASIAQHVGWTLEELFELQTYPRYGYHMNNAVSAETLVLLRAP